VDAKMSTLDILGCRGRQVLAERDADAARRAVDVQVESSDLEHRPGSWVARVMGTPTCPVLEACQRSARQSGGERVLSAGLMPLFGFLRRERHPHDDRPRRSRMNCRRWSRRDDRALPPQVGGRLTMVSSRTAARESASGDPRETSRGNVGWSPDVSELHASAVRPYGCSSGEPSSGSSSWTDEAGSSCGCRSRRKNRRAASSRRQVRARRPTDGERWHASSTGQVGVPMTEQPRTRPMFQVEDST